MIRPATPLDSASICLIYNHYVVNTHATFEESPASPEEMSMRIKKVLADGLPWLILEVDDQIIGFSRAVKWRDRSAYRYSVESSIYIAPTHTGRGLGAQLYAALLSQLKTLGAHAVMAGIALPNPASLALHHKFGYKNVARFIEVGWKFNRWIDVEYWQYLI